MITTTTTDQLGSLTPLTTEIEWMQYCERCDQTQPHIATHYTDPGLIAICTACLLAHIQRWTRSATILPRSTSQDEAS